MPAAPERAGSIRASSASTWVRSAKAVPWAAVAAISGSALRVAASSPPTEATQPTSEWMAAGDSRTASCEPAEGLGLTGHRAGEDVDADVDQLDRQPSGVVGDAGHHRETASGAGRRCSLIRWTTATTPARARGPVRRTQLRGASASAAGT
ncbi:hypothetical protein [Modestobacter roseus]|uniref:hypothetical protein n=1 Tax=Modestobacter roseus TaxID=1181884 RepID=UPI0012963818|nr:hypothetical protein [Modestobacter roseus]MQA33729.1 hypothetical protein [Modestobacter roseus]